MSDDSHARILVVDDESSLRRVLSTSLTMMGFIVSVEPTGEQAIECVRSELFDAVLLDLNMPGIGGMATCRVLRQQYPRLGILMVTVRQDPKDKIEALEAGADDYIVKPFDLLELVARLRTVIRRTRLSSPDRSTPIRIGDLELNWRERSLTRSGQSVHLTPNEFALLHCLMSRAGELVLHADVVRLLWDQDEGGDLRRLRSLVYQLRKKIELNAEEPTYLLSEPGFGYRFRSGQR
jgi:two-component system, OmpR family, KDP operon response regulator KdpE